MNTIKCMTFIVASVLCMSLCAASESKSPAVKKEVFGKTNDGNDVYVFTLTNKNAVIAKVIELGAHLIRLEVPDREGKFANITTGYDSLQRYRNSYEGATIGRYANRIANAAFKIDGIEYKATSNLHGGRRGFHTVLWKGAEFQNDNEAGVKLTYLSKDGEEGYPGNLNCTVTFALTNDNELKINYEAVTDKPTVVNFTNHAYFNLAGAGNGQVMGHEIYVNADKYTPFDRFQIPTGEISTVKGTPFDFTEPNTIGSKISGLGQGGYDHNFVINGWDGKKLILAARVYEPAGGRVMEVLTTEPGMQFYTSRGEAFCLETQHFPDSPNHAEFPSTILRPNETFKSQTIYKFSKK
ncbi:MAG: galactose mutarotase [Sedimentisphaerales bacterium]|nr:galactose mutarotase [Sedimentisphaerales bacterium]